MSRLHTLRVAILSLLFAGVAAHAADSTVDPELEAAADQFAHGYDSDWNKRNPDNLKVLAGEVAKVAECNEATEKALKDGTQAIAEKMADIWRALYRVYYIQHHDDLQSGGLWDAYPDLLESEACRKGMADLWAQWDALLKKTLSAGEHERWAAEQKQRRERRDKAMSGWIDFKMEELEKKVRKTYESTLSTFVSKAGLSEERREALKPAVEAAVAAQSKLRRALAGRSYKSAAGNFIHYRTKSIEALEKHTGTEYVAGDGVGARASQKAFDEVVRKILSADELSRIKKVDEENEARIVKIAKDMADTAYARYEAEGKLQADARTKKLIRCAPLDAERAKTLSDKLAAAETAIVADWKKAFVPTTIKNIKQTISGRGDVEDNLKQMEMGRWSFNDEKADLAATKARGRVWDTVVAELVKPEELARWHTVDEREKNQLSATLAHVAVAELDRMLLLQPEQRTSIEPLMMEAAKPLGGAISGLNEIWQSNMDATLMLLPAIGSGKVEALLDAPQKKRYQELLKRWQPNWDRFQRGLRRKG